MMNKINNVSKSIPSPCKKDCPNRCCKCKLDCKEFKEYEALKMNKHNNSSSKIHRDKQDYFIREYDKYRFLRSGTVKGINVDNLKLLDDGNSIKINLCNDGISKKYSLDKVIFKIFNGKYDFNDKKIRIIHKDGNYRNCSFDNLESVIK